MFEPSRIGWNNDNNLLCASHGMNFKFFGFSNKFSIRCVCLTASRNIQCASALCGLMQAFQYASEQFRIIYDPIYQIEIEKLCDKFAIYVCLPFRLIVGYHLQINGSYFFSLPDFHSIQLKNGKRKTRKSN